MKNKHLYGIWGCLFIICALLGFIPEPTGIVKVLLILSAAAFFVPGWLLYYRAAKGNDIPTLQCLLGLSLTSLCATLIFLVLNFLSAGNPNISGDFLYALLIIFSSPMVCAQYWIASLFLWACLLIASFSAARKAKKGLSQQ